MTPCASATVIEKKVDLRTIAKQIVLAWRSLGLVWQVAQTTLQAANHSMPLFGATCPFVCRRRKRSFEAGQAAELGLKSGDLGGASWKGLLTAGHEVPLAMSGFMRPAKPWIKLCQPWFGEDVPAVQASHPLLVIAKWPQHFLR